MSRKPEPIAVRLHAMAGDFSTGGLTHMHCVLDDTPGAHVAGISAYYADCGAVCIPAYASYLRTLDVCRRCDGRHPGFAGRWLGRADG